MFTKDGIMLHAANTGIKCRVNGNTVETIPEFLDFDNFIKISLFLGGLGVNFDPSIEFDIKSIGKKAQTYGPLRVKRDFNDNVVIWARFNTKDIRFVKEMVNAL